VQNGIASARVFQTLPTGNKLIQGILPTCFLRWQVESIASESVKHRLVCQANSKCDSPATPVYRLPFSSKWLESLVDSVPSRHGARTASTLVARALHRRMDANQQMRWSPRGAHLMLKVRTSVVNGTFNKDHATAERRARRPFHQAA